MSDNGDGKFDPVVDVPLSINEGEEDGVESEAVIDEDALDISESSIEDIVDAIKNEGYEVNPDADSIQADDLGISEDVIENEVDDFDDIDEEMLDEMSTSSENQI